MKTLKLPKSISRTFGKVGLQMKKHSPEILVVTGIVGGVTSAVLACKATTKASDILEEAKKNIDDIHAVTNNPEWADRYTADDAKKDLTIVYAQTGLKFAKLYAPAVLLGAASIGCILASSNIMRKRNLALAAAYTAVDKGFKGYRNNVIERFGEELDRELKYNIKTKEVEEVVVNEDGTESTITKTVEVANTNEWSPFARCFDDGCKGWTKDPEINLMFLRDTQRFANEKLQEDGYLYINDVYEMLGFPKTKEGSVVGWVYDPKNPELDNFVDFGIYDRKANPECVAFVNGHERSIWLDFNYSGVVYELIR